MGYTKEEQELDLKIKGQLELERLTKELEAEDEALKRVRASLDAGEASQAEYDRQLARSAPVIAAHTEAIKKAQAAVGGYQQNITALGYAFNDFFSVQGGFDQKLNAIANNLPMVFAGLGGVGLALGAIVPIAAAIVRNWETIRELFTGEVDLPKTTGSLKEMGEALKEIDKQLKSIGESRYDDATTAEKYNKLLGLRLETEKNITAEKDKQALLKKLADLKDESAEKLAKGGAKILQDQLAGQQEAIIKGAAAGEGSAKLDALIAARAGADRKLAAAPAGRVDPRTGERTSSPEAEAAGAEGRRLDEAIRAEQLARQSRARELVAEAMVRGDPKAIAELQKRMGARPELFTDQQRTVFGMAGPAAVAADDLAKLDYDKQLKKVAADKEAARKKAAEGAAAKAEAAKIEAESKAAAEAGGDVLMEMMRKDAETEKMADRHAAEQRKDRGKQVKDAAKDVGTSSLDEQAAAAAATLRRQGGYVDQFNREIKQNQDQQQSTLAADIFRLLRQQRPDMGKGMAQDVAVKMAQDAMEHTDDAIATARSQIMEQARVTGQSVTLAQAQMAAMAEVQATQAAQYQQMLQLQAAARNVAAGARQMRRGMERGAVDEPMHNGGLR